MANSKKNIFPTEIVNEIEYKQNCEYIKQLAQSLPEQLAILQKEGLANTLTEIEELSAMDNDAYLALIKRLYREYLSKIGFCPSAEKQRVIRNFDALFDSTKDAVAYLHEFKENGYNFVLGKNGEVQADTEKSRQIAKEQCTTKINADALSEYWEQWAKLRDAWQALHEWEKAHNMSETLFGENFSFVTSKGELGLRNIEHMITSQDENFNDIFFKMFAYKFAQ